MGATGIGLYGFLFTHLLGNLGMLGGAERYNKYGYLLLHQLSEIIIPAEIGLIAMLVVHVFLAISLTRENRAARPVAYAVKKRNGMTAHSASMMITGSAILIFVFIHIANFRFGGAGMGGMGIVNYGGVEMKDLYGNALRAFSQWWYAGAYVLVMILIFSHLSHGVQSSLQSLGVNHPKYTPLIRIAGRGYAVLMSGGFIFLAVWAYFQHGGTP